MPKRSRRNGRRRMGRRRPRRSFRKRKLRRVRANTIHSYIRTTETVYTIYYGSTISIGDNFTLASTPNYAEFTALYDQYKITGVKRTFIYSATAADATGPIGAYGPAGAPMLYSIRDYDDSAPENVSSMLQRPYVSIRRITSLYKCFIRPRPNVLLGTSGAISESVPNRAGWVDIAYPNVLHYGHKWNLVPQGGPSGSIAGVTVLGTLRIIDRYYLKMKNPR